MGSFLGGGGGQALGGAQGSLGGGNLDFISQIASQIGGSGGGPGPAGFIIKGIEDTGKILSSFDPDRRDGKKKDESALIDAFIEQVMGQGISPISNLEVPTQDVQGSTLQDIIRSQPTTSQGVDANLGDINDRLLRGRAQGGGISVPPILQNEPSVLEHPLIKRLFPDLGIPSVQPLNLFQRQRF